MALTAKFQADFSSFLNAIDKATLATADLGKGAEKVESTLNRMVDNFSGRKIIQEASLMTIAVEKAGGVSALTAKELQAVSAKADEAAEKLKKLGYEVPVGLEKLRAGIADIGVESAKTNGVLDGLQQQLLGMFSVGAVIAFGKEVLDAGDKIQKMADQTGLSTEEVQKLEYIAGQSGTSIESLVGAVQNLQVRLGDENSGAAGAFAKLGIEVDAFQRLGTYEQMTTLGEAIKNIHDPTQQASVAAALFGKTWKEILPAIKSGMKETGDQAVIMADDTVKSLDRIGDTLKAAKQAAISWGGTFVTAIEGSAFAVGNFLSTFDPAHFGVSNTQLLKLAAAVNDPDGLYGALSKLPPAAKSVDAGLKSVALSAADAATVAKDLTRQGNESITMHKDAAKAAAAHAVELEKAAKAEEKFRDSVKGLSFGTFIADTSKLNAIVPDLSGHLAEQADKFAEARDQMDDLASSGIELTRVETATGAIIGGTVIPMFSKLPNVVAQSTKAIEDAGKTIETSLGDKVSTALGGMVKILHLGNTAFGDFAASAAQGAKSILDSWKNAHDVFGVVVAAASTAISLFGKLFSNAEKQINPVREAFVQVNGGLDALNQKAVAAGTTLDALLNAKNPEQYKKAIDDLNKAFDDQKAKIEANNKSLGDLLTTAETFGTALPQALKDSIQKLIDMGTVTGDTASIFAQLTGQTGVDFKKMQEIAGKYGIDLASLGPAFQSARLHDAAGIIINDFDTLTRGGADADAVLAGMRKPINDLVNDSIKFGVDIPANMKPWIEQLIKTGQLTDENGDKITDVSKLKFSDPIVTEFDKIIAKLQELIDKITGPNGVTAGINGIPAKKTVEIVTVHTDVDGNAGDGGPALAARGGIVTTSGVQYLAGGGRVLPWPSRGSDTVPAMLTPGEGVVSRRGMASLGRAGLAAINRGGGMGGGGVAIVNNYSIAADVDSPAARERLRRTVDQATMQALRRQKRTNVA